MKTEDDLLWIQRSLKGDTNAFGFLVDKYQDAVFTILRRILKRDDEAADAAQTVFIKAYEALPRFITKFPNKTYLIMIYGMLKTKKNS